jgi:hypothetical protein
MASNKEFSLSGCVSFRFLKAAVMSTKMPVEPASSSGSRRYGWYSALRKDVGSLAGFDNLPATQYRAECGSRREGKGLRNCCVEGWERERRRGVVGVFLFYRRLIKAGSLLRWGECGTCLPCLGRPSRQAALVHEVTIRSRHSSLRHVMLQRHGTLTRLRSKGFKTPFTAPTTPYCRNNSLPTSL